MLARSRRCLLGLSLACACAGGAPSSGMYSGGFASVGADDDSTTSAGDDTADAEGSASDSTGGGAVDSDTSTTGPVGESSSSGADESGGNAMCTNVATCPGAMMIGQVSGDGGSGPIMAEGSEPTWVTFRVTEDNDDLTGEEVSFTATLSSPVGYDFDLWVYRGPDGGSTGCNGALETSESAGTTDVVDMSWGEGAVANGGDESAWIAVEIRSKNGVCDPGAIWTLMIAGDT